MGTFSSEQCDAIAAQFQELSWAILRKRLSLIHEGVPANDSALIELQTQQISLGDISDEFALKAADLTLDNADQAVTKISGSLELAKSALRTLDKVDRVVSIASEAITLSVAIYGGNFDQIVAAAKALQQASA